MEDEHPTRVDIYVELDTILDTRLGTLFLIDESLVRGAFTGQEYMGRVKDNFGWIGSKLFKKIYECRDQSVLQVSEVTPMVNMVNDYCVQAMSSDIMSGGKGDIKIYINTYPYELTEEFKEEMKDKMGDLFTSVHEIVIVDGEHISGEWLQENIGMAVMYDPMSYVEKDMAVAGKTNPLDVVLVGPMSIAGKGQPNEDMWKNMQISVATYIKLRLMPMMEFCPIIMKKKLEDE